jgi:FkbM family methyltransferase
MNDYKLWGKNRDTVQEHAQYQFIKLCMTINSKFQLIGFDRGKISNALKKVYDDDSMRNEFVKLICPGNEINFSDGKLKVQDRQAIWAVVNEILYNEDYYFQTDKKRPRIFDLGSNFGLAIYYFKHLYPNCLIDAFEPDPDIFTILERNIENNSWTGITTHNCALNGVEGSFVFYKNLEKTLAGSLTTRRIGKEKTISIQVQCKRLSKFLPEHIDFLKIDVEGVEDMVLRDIQSQLGNIDRIFCEYHQGDNLANDRFFRIISLLEENNYAYHIAPSILHNPHNRPMLHVGIPYSRGIWARRRDIS